MWFLCTFWDIHFRNGSNGFFVVVTVFRCLAILSCELKSFNSTTAYVLFWESIIGCTLICISSSGLKEGKDSPNELYVAISECYGVGIYKEKSLCFMVRDWKIEVHGSGTGKSFHLCHPMVEDRKARESETESRRTVGAGFEFRKDWLLRWFSHSHSDDIIHSQQQDLCDPFFSVALELWRTHTNHRNLFLRYYTGYRIGSVLGLKLLCI